VAAAEALDAELGAVVAKLGQMGHDVSEVGVAELTAFDNRPLSLNYAAERRDAHGLLQSAEEELHAVARHIRDAKDRLTMASTDMWLAAGKTG